MTVGKIVWGLQQALLATTIGGMCKQSRATLLGDAMKVRDSIRPLAELEARKVLAIPYMRVSTWEQRRNGNARRRADRLRQCLHEKGIRHIDVYIERETTGKSLAERTALREAVLRAKREAADHPNYIVVIVTDTRNRFVRGGETHRDANAADSGGNQNAERRCRQGNPASGYQRCPQWKRRSRYAFDDNGPARRSSS